MSTRDKIITETVEKYAKSFFSEIEKHPKSEIPLVLLAMSEIIRAYLCSPYAMTSKMKKEYHEMKKYCENKFDANITMTFHTDGGEQV